MLFRVFILRKISWLCLKGSVAWWVVFEELILDPQKWLFEYHRCFNVEGCFSTFKCDNLCRCVKSLMCVGSRRCLLWLVI